MRILGIDTATTATAVGLLQLADDGRERSAVERRDDPPAGARPRHTAVLLGLAVDALDATGIDWEQIDLIAVGTGPGTFTGLRIGIATARALAHAREIPIVGVSTLRSLAAQAAAAGADRVPVAAIDARRGELFAAAWTDPRDHQDPPLIAPAPIAPEALCETLARGRRRWLVAGDGAVRFREVLERSGAVIPDDGCRLHRVSALEHCRLASGLSPQNPNDVSPDYLRRPDAERNLRRGSTR